MDKGVDLVRNEKFHEASEIFEMQKSTLSLAIYQKHIFIVGRQTVLSVQRNFYW